MITLKAASTHPVARVVFSPDGTLLAADQPHTGVTLFDRATGTPARTLAMPRIADHSGVVFCAGGANVAVGSLRGIHLFDTATGDRVGHLGGVPMPMLIEHGDGALAAYGFQVFTVEVSADLPRPRLVYSVRSQKSSMTVCALSPCGRWGIGLRERSRPVLFNLETGQVVAVIDCPCRENGAYLQAVTFSADGTRFVLRDGSGVSVYDTSEQNPDDDSTSATSVVQRVAGTAVAPKPATLLEPCFKLERPRGVDPADRWLPPVALTPDGRGLLIRRPRNRVQFWDIATGAQAGEWSWRLDGVVSLAVAPDGLTAAAGCRFGRVVVWDLE